MLGWPARRFRGFGAQDQGQSLVAELTDLCVRKRLHRIMHVPRHLCIPFPLTANMKGNS